MEMNNEIKAVVNRESSSGRKEKVHSTMHDALKTLHIFEDKQKRKRIP